MRRAAGVAASVGFASAIFGGAARAHLSLGEIEDAGAIAALRPS